MSNHKENVRANTRLIDILQDLLSRGLQDWTQTSVNRESFEGMYGYLEHSIMELFAKASFNLTHDAKRWMAQKLYLSIRYTVPGQIAMPDNSHLHSAPKVFDEIDIRLIPTEDLRMLGSLLSDCDFAPEVAKELRRRS